LIVGLVCPRAGFRLARDLHVVVGDGEHLASGRRVGEVCSDLSRVGRAGVPMGRFVPQRVHWFTLGRRAGKAATRAGGVIERF